jgi:hypothetical protein
MSLPFTPRHKRPVMPFVQKKLVRVDIRTQIEVPVTVSDSDAISRFYARYESYKHYAGQGTPNIPNTPNYPVRDEFKEIPMGSVEDLASIDDAELPEVE